MSEPRLAGRSGSRFRATGLRVIATLVVLALVEGLCDLGLFVAEREAGLSYRPMNELSEKHARILRRLVAREPSYQESSAALGWTIRPNARTPIYRANAAGIRSDREYALDRPSGVVRIATFGDSFTHGDAVANRDTWEAILEKGSAGAWEVLNFGVGGYGLDQAYLRYLEEGIPYRPQIVAIGFMSENIFRHVNRFRPFYFADTAVPLGKPRFRIDDEELSRLANPLPELGDYERLLAEPERVLPRVGEGDYYYRRGYASGALDVLGAVRLTKMLTSELRARLFDEDILIDGRYNQSSEAFAITTRLIDQFRSAVLAAGSTPLVVVFPVEEDVARYRASGETRYSPLLAYLAARAHVYVDLMEALEGYPEQEALFTGYHYSPLANRLVAERIRRAVRELVGEP